MAATKVTHADLRAYVDAGHSQANAARHFGVSEPAIHQRLKRMRTLISQVVALEKAGEVVEEKLSATARLERVQQVIESPALWLTSAWSRSSKRRSSMSSGKYRRKSLSGSSRA